MAKPTKSLARRILEVQAQDDKFREAARLRWAEEGRLEIDDNAPISRAPGDPDKGAYVQAWVWVYNEDAV